MKVCMAVLNIVTIDARVKGEAAALQKAGHDVTIVGKWKRGYSREEYLDGVRVIRPAGPYTLVSKLWDLFLASPYIFKGMEGLRARFSVLREKRKSEGLTRVLSQQAADVYHAHDCNVLLECTRAAEHNGSMLVYDSHELWLDLHINKNHTAQYRVDAWTKTEAECAPKADLVITVCECIAKRLQEMYALRELPTVIYNCSPLREYMHMDYLREKYLHTPKERRIILYQGVIQVGRGLEKLVELAHLMPEYDFVIIGPVNSKELEAELRKQSRDISNVYILPPVGHDELWKITCSADFGYVCTEPYCDSYRFSMTNKMFAYLVAGIPLIANDLPGHREMLEKCPEGAEPAIIVPMDDPEQVAAQVRAVAGDDGRYEKMARDSYAAARDVFNREREHAKLADRYAALEEKLREKRGE